MVSDIRGRSFKQNNLPADLRNAIAGHKPYSKVLLLLLVAILSGLAGIFMGFISGSISLELVIGDPFSRLISIVVLPLLLVWLIVVTFKGFIPSLWIVIAGIVATALVLRISNLSLYFEERVLFYTGILTAIAIVLLSFICIRLALSLGDMVLNKFKRFQLLSIFSLVILATLITAHGMLSLEQFGETVGDSLLEQRQQRFLDALPFVRYTTFLGVTFISALWLIGAWYANYRRRVPWQHPDPFRLLALSIGSWQGTSFHKLDLSGVNFCGAQLANSDLRAWKLYRTNFQGGLGLKRARVNSRYMDLELPKVQQLLTQGGSEDSDYSRLNLQGAFLRGNDLRRFQFTDTDLNGAYLSDADLRGAILARTQVVGVDFSNANLTGVCIKDWSVNDQTLFTNVLCDYVYRELDEKGEPTDRYPADRNFEPQEFESLYQELGNVAELVFKEGVNWRAFSFSMQKLDLEDEGLGLELKGFERRGDRWVVRVTHNQHIPKQEVESRLLDMYDDMKGLLAAKEDQIHQLLGIASDQAESIKELSQKPFGNSFFITGSTITNLTGSGNIEYTEAAHQVREIITHGSDRKQAVPIVNQFARQLKQQDVATKKTEQLELIQQLIVAEAEADPEFQDYLLKESQQILQAMAGTPLNQVIQGAVEALLPQK